MRPIIGILLIQLTAALWQKVKVEEAEHVPKFTDIGRLFPDAEIQDLQINLEISAITKEISMLKRHVVWLLATGQSQKLI